MFCHKIRFLVELYSVLDFKAWFFPIFTKYKERYSSFVFEEVILELFKVLRAFWYRTFYWFINIGGFKIEWLLISHSWIGFKDSSLTHPWRSPGRRVLYKTFICSLRRITDRSFEAFATIMERAFYHLVIRRFTWKLLLEGWVVGITKIRGWWNDRIVEFGGLNRPLVGIFYVGRGIVPLLSLF